MLPVPSAVAPRMPIDSPRITQASNDSLKLSWHPARIPAYAQTTPITYVVEMKEPVAQAWKPVADRLHDTCYKVWYLKDLYAPYKICIPL